MHHFALGLLLPLFQLPNPLLHRTLGVGEGTRVQ
jgi:hypothetical protein